VRNEYDFANARTVRTSSTVRGVGYNGASDIWDDDGITDEDEHDDDEVGGRSGIDFSMTRVSPRSARVNARTHSRRVVLVPSMMLSVPWVKRRRG
jgi:hypothetical protein